MYMVTGSKATTNATLSPGPYAVTLSAMAPASTLVNVTVNGVQVGSIGVSASAYMQPLATAQFSVTTSPAVVQLSSASAVWIDNILFVPYTSQPPAAARPPSPPPSPPVVIAPPSPPPMPPMAITAATGVVAQRLVQAAQQLVRTGTDSDVTAALRNASNVASNATGAIAFMETVVFRVQPPATSFFASPLVVVAVFDTANVTAAPTRAVNGGSVDNTFCGASSPSAQVVVLGTSSDRALAMQVMSYSTKAGIYARPTTGFNAALEGTVNNQNSRRTQFMTAGGTASFIADNTGGFMVPFTHSDSSAGGKYVRVCALAASGANSYALPSRRLAQTASGMSTAQESASMLLSVPPSPPPSPPPTLLGPGVGPLAIYSVRNTSLAPASFDTYGGPLLRVTGGGVAVDVYQLTSGAALTLANGTSLQQWLGGRAGYVTTWYDQSGNNHHATGAAVAGGSSPTLAFMTYNQTTVYFANQMSYMTIALPVSGTKAAWATFTALTPGATGTTTLFGDTTSDISLRLWPGVQGRASPPPDPHPRALRTKQGYMVRMRFIFARSALGKGSGEGLPSPVVKC